MPKSTKKKKDKAADFSKAKLKLGKGKQTPSNAIDTSFKARSIALPSQSIVVDKDADAPTTKRRLTLDALIHHLKHYNATTRKDAILGLRELFEAHPELISTNLTTLVNSCVRLIGDEDASVRKALLSFFTWLFRQIPHDNWLPHSPVLLLFTTSAQTHIFPEIRIDAVRFLDIYLEYIPDVVTDGWIHSGGGSHGRRVLEGYLGILNAGTTFGEGGDTGPIQATSTASVVLSPASKLAVLKSLSSFLAHAIHSSWNTRETSESSSSNSHTPTWYLSSSFASTSAFEAFDAMLHSSFSDANQPSRTERHWTAEPTEDGENFVSHFPFASTSFVSGWSLNELSMLEDIISKSSDGGYTGMGPDPEVTCSVQLARTLQSTLVATFLDCAPAVFSPSASPSETELQMVLVVCRISRSLYGRILQDTAECGTPHHTSETDLQALLSYLSPYFPFTVISPSAARRDIKTEHTFQDLNLIYCELSSFLALASQYSTTAKPPRPTRRADPARPTGGISASAFASEPAVQARQLQRVSAYVVQLLRGQVQGAALPRPITSQAYVALLPTVWSLLNGKQADRGRDEDSTTAAVFSAIVDHAIKVSSTSAVKRHTIEFIGRLVLLERETEYVGSFRIGRTVAQDAKLEEWILQLPKSLWEIGGNNLAATEVIARFLLRLFQHRSPLLQPTTCSALQSRLVPYFSIAHPTRGKLPGPYTKLPTDSPLRRLLLDLVATILRQTGIHRAGDDDLVLAVRDSLRDAPEASYWEGIFSRA